jgi:hypothetical protein
MRSRGGLLLISLPCMVGMHQHQLHLYTADASHPLLITAPAPPAFTHSPSIITPSGVSGRGMYLRFTRGGPYLQPCRRDRSRWTSCGAHNE